MAIDCFQRKRKISNSAPSSESSVKPLSTTTLSMTTLSVTVKRPAPPPPTVELRRKEVELQPAEEQSQPQQSIKENRISKLYKMISTGDKVTNVRSILKRTKPTVGTVSDPDPSYGFASRYSDSKSYFRTHNVDNTIPTAMKREDLLDADLGDGNFRDVLFPLRSSGGSQKSGGGWTTPGETLRASGQDDVLYSPPQKKRVKFENTVDAPVEPKPFAFPSSNSDEVASTSKPSSLRDRIYDFFANLF